MITAWNIRSRAKTCSSCFESFIAGHKGTSFLFTSDEGISRQDLCETCFQQKSQAYDNAFSFWHFTIDTPSETASQETLPKETAETLFKRLITLNQPNDHAVIYILSIMLERTKILIERSVKYTQEETKLRVYEHRKSGETFVVVDPEIKLDQLTDVQKRIVDLLESINTHSPTAPNKETP